MNYQLLLFDFVLCCCNVNQGDDLNSKQGHDVNVNQGDDLNVIQGHDVNQSDDQNVIQCHDVNQSDDAYQIYPETLAGIENREGDCYQ